MSQITIIYKVGIYKVGIYCLKIQNYLKNILLFKIIQDLYRIYQNAVNPN